jgi:hypothetical protein
VNEKIVPWKSVRNSTDCRCVGAKLSSCAPVSVARLFHVKIMRAYYTSNGEWEVGGVGVTCAIFKDDMSPRPTCISSLTARYKSLVGVVPNRNHGGVDDGSENAWRFGFILRPTRIGSFLWADGNPMWL